MRKMGHVACIEVTRDACMVLVGKPEGKTPHGRPRHRWEDTIKMGLQEIGWRVGGMTGLIWLRTVTGGVLL